MKYQVLKKRDIKRILPKREVNAHKGDFGRVLLLCGSKGYTGAAALAALGALRCGAGIVYLGVPESIYAIEAGKLLEPVVFPLADENGMFAASASEEIAKILPQMNAVLIGPGIGRSEGTLTIVQYILENADCPVILDADGINVISPHKDILRGRKNQTILTPHWGEFLRIYPDSPPNRVDAAVVFAKEYHCIVLLKGHNTVITDGVACFINPTGNPGMATGGSGDVLAGMIAALVGQGITPLYATACGAWLHGYAGDICAKKLSQYGMLPQDMLQILPRLLP